MTLAAGTRLGPYQIEAMVGAGGMGEVYKARDTRLDRTVAIKTLPQQIVHDPDRRRRIEQEARAISALNHARICTLYDIGNTGPLSGMAASGVYYLVMEYLQGQTLAARLEKGPVPLPEAVDYAGQIAEALSCAHEAGVVHRDLKPGNIMLVKGGVKLLDFGLAKLRAAATPTEAGVSELMTQNPSTTPGTVLGTVQYMAPEQLEGREVDGRADLWAFGCVLYEMTTGRHAFEGRSHASLIAAIMEHEPTALTKLDPMSPPSLEHLIKRCLAKDPEERWQSARDVLHEINWVAETATKTDARAAVIRRFPWRERLGWSLIVLALAAVVVWLVALRSPSATNGPGVMRFAVTAPGTGTVLADTTAGVISPDGQHLVFTVVDPSGNARLWVRTLDALSVTQLPGTENAVQPFWSPDGRTVAFFSDGKLRKVSIAGEPADAICDAPDGRGGSWGKDGVIVFAPRAEGPLYQISADGSGMAEVARPDTSRGERALRFPVFLPDGRHFLYVSVPRRADGLLDVYLGDLGSKERGRVMTASSVPVPAGPEYLIYALGDRLVAQRFDASRLEPVGAVTTLSTVPRYSRFDGAPSASASLNGIVAHPPTSQPNTELVWLDRAGRQISKISLPTATYINPAVSPDGRWVAVERMSSSAAADLWLVDLQRGVPSRLTFDGSVATTTPFWSQDSTRIAFQHSRGGVYDIYEVSASGSAEPKPLVQSNIVYKVPDAWSKDGKYLVFSQIEGPTGWDLWLLPLQGDRKPVPYLRTPFNELAADISPDGRWLAYSSDESGTFQIYVRSFPQPGEKHQVSVSTGTGVLWSQDGRKLLISANNPFIPIMGPISVVDVETSPTFKTGTPRILFTPRQDIIGLTATGDLQRFVAAVPADSEPPSSFTVVVDWQAALRR